MRKILKLKPRIAVIDFDLPGRNGLGNVDELRRLRNIHKENLQSLQFKFDLIGHLADAIHDLVVSPATFERDFEKHFRKLLQTRTNLVTKNYTRYQNSLIKSRRAARAHNKKI